jgi:hypothetical protein
LIALRLMMMIFKMSSPYGFDSLRREASPLGLNGTAAFG